MLEKAIDIAVEAHRGQMDKVGVPYILHPLRVMLMGKNQDEMIVGVLHDVVEDTPVSIDMLRDEGFNKNVLEALIYISRGKNETYAQFIERIKGNDLAVQVKIYDLMDNMSRDIPNPTEHDYARRDKYEKAYANLLSFSCTKNL